MRKSSSTSPCSSAFDHGLAQVVVGRPQRQARDRRLLVRLRPHRVLHRLPFSQQVGHAAEVRRLERTRLGLDPQPLHDEVEQVRIAEVHEVEDRRVLQAVELQVRVRARVRRHERRRRHAEHVLRVFLPALLPLPQQLAAGNPHQLDADAHEPHVVDVGRHVWPRPGEAHPGAIGLGLREDAVTELRRQAVVDDELRAHDAMGLGVAAALESARLPEPAHLRLEGVDDRLGHRFFVRLDPFLGELQSFVRALPVDQCGGQARDRIAQQRIEGRTHPGVDASLELQQPQRRVADPVEERRAGVGRRHRAARHRTQHVSLHHDSPFQRAAAR